MNISREKSEGVAEKMTSKIKAEIAEAKNKRKEVVNDQVMDDAPPEILECFKRYPSYFNTEKTLYVQGEGMSREWGFNSSLPTKNTEINLTPARAAEFVRLSNQIEDLNKKWRKSYRDIVAALLSIKTYNRCKEAFPEAYALLPDANTGKLLPVVQIDKIREELGLPIPNER